QLATRPLRSKAESYFDPVALKE
ncbi:hypothetical protein CEXT_578731, partial [Caerostris extrusa]